MTQRRVSDQRQHARVRSRRCRAAKRLERGQARPSGRTNTLARSACGRQQAPAETARAYENFGDVGLCGGQRRPSIHNASTDEYLGDVGLSASVSSVRPSRNDARVLGRRGRECRRGGRVARTRRREGAAGEISADEARAKRRTEKPARVRRVREDEAQTHRAVPRARGRLMVRRCSEDRQQGNGARSIDAR